MSEQINNHTYSSTSGFVQMGAFQGWQCPICKKVNAPWVQQCPCNGQIDWTTTTTIDWTHHDTLTNDTITMNEANKNSIGKHAKIDYTENTTAYYDAASGKTIIKYAPKH